MAAKTKRIKHKLDDRYIQALREFDTPWGEDAPKVAVVWDTRVDGLRIRVGTHRASWTFYREFRDHGKRGTVSKVLGHWPAMNVAQARAAALVVAGRIASGRREPGKRAAVRFE